MLRPAGRHLLLLLLVSLQWVVLGPRLQDVSTLACFQRAHNASTARGRQMGQDINRGQLQVCRDEAQRGKIHRTAAGNSDASKLTTTVVAGAEAIDRDRLLTPGPV